MNELEQKKADLVAKLNVVNNSINDIDLLEWRRSNPEVQDLLAKKENLLFQIKQINKDLDSYIKVACDDDEYEDEE